MTRLRHDQAHRIMVRLLMIVAPALRDQQQQQAFYREAMPVLMEGIAEYDSRREREAERLAWPDT